MDKLYAGVDIWFKYLYLKIFSYSAGGTFVVKLSCHLHLTYFFPMFLFIYILYSIPKAYLEPSGTSTMIPFSKKVND